MHRSVQSAIGRLELFLVYVSLIVNTLSRVSTQLSSLDDSRLRQVTRRLHDDGRRRQFLCPSLSSHSLDIGDPIHWAIWRK